MGYLTYIVTHEATELYSIAIVSFVPFILKIRGWGKAESHIISFQLQISIAKEKNSFIGLVDGALRTEPTTKQSHTPIVVISRLFKSVNKGIKTITRAVIPALLSS